MPKIINASSFPSTQINPQLTLYHNANAPSLHLAHVSVALQPETWKKNFEPFAYIISDTKTHEIVLVRDHLGMQPLYYYYQQDVFIFAETIPDIIQQLNQTPAFNAQELNHLFTDQSLYSDNTFHQGIVRVEPGCMVHIQPDGQVHKKAFWQLTASEPLVYSRDDEYLEHFTELLHEAVKLATYGHQRVAMEFSGGIDSSALYCTAVAEGLNPTAFLHEPIAGSAAAIYDERTLNAMLAHYPHLQLQRISADNFDPLTIFQRYAQWFAGPAPHIFYMLAQPIHQAVASQNHTLLLSGFGGDQCVSAHLPARLIVPDLLKHQHYRAAWQALHSANQSPLSWLRQARELLSYSCPELYAVNRQLSTIKRRLTRPFTRDVKLNPYYTTYHRTLSAGECNLLQGPLSHEIRLRIEYSSIVSKHFGFEYRYPLLYPKLLDFFLTLPLEQKRRGGIGRYLMRRYMGQYLPGPIFDDYQKSTGLHILPGTMEKCRRHYQQDWRQGAFQNLPYPHYRANGTEQQRLIRSIHAYMLTCV